MNAFLAYIQIVDPDQTAPRGSMIWVHTVCFKDVLKGQADHAQNLMTVSSGYQLARVNNEKKTLDLKV